MYFGGVRRNHADNRFGLFPKPDRTVEWIFVEKAAEHALESFDAAIRRESTQLLAFLLMIVGGIQATTVVRATISLFMIP